MDEHKEVWVQFACAALNTSWVANMAAKDSTGNMGSPTMPPPMPESMAKHAARVADAMVVEFEKRSVK